MLDRRVVKWANVISRSSGAFCTLALGDSGLDDVVDQAAVPFHKREPIRQTAFQQHAYSVVSGKVRCGYEGYVFSNP